MWLQLDPQADGDHFPILKGRRGLTAHIGGAQSQWRPTVERAQKKIHERGVRNKGITTIQGRVASETVAQLNPPMEKGRPCQDSVSGERSGDVIQGTHSRSIRQIEAKALAKLRKHKDARKLYEYLQ